MIRIGLVSNPQSRRNRRGLPAVEHLAGRRDLVHRCLEPGAAPAEVLAELARHEVDLLAINGGDGTVQRLLTTLLVERLFATVPALAVLAGGTTNAIAGDVGLRGAPARGLQRLLALAREGRIEHAMRLRHVMRLDHLAEHGPQYGMLLAAAVPVRAIEHYRACHANNALPGGMALGLTLGHLLADRLRPAERRRIVRGDAIGVALDGGPCQEACRFLLLVTTLVRLVFGARPYWNQTGAPLRLTSIAHPPRQLLRALARVVILHGDGSTLPADSYASHSARRLALSGVPALALDGEIFRPGPDRPVVVTACGPLRFVAA